MSKKRRTFTSEFKAEAASLILDKNHSYAEVCRSLEVGETALRRWVNQLKAERDGETPKNAKAITPDQQKIQALEKRIKELEEDKLILKKATALLMSDEIRNKR